MITVINEGRLFVMNGFMEYYISTEGYELIHGMIMVKFGASAPSLIAGDIE